jgi:hypothetical protein
MAVKVPIQGRAVTPELVIRHEFRSKPGDLHIIMSGVRTTDVAVAAITEALFNSPVGGALAGQATGSVIAARRMLRLAVTIARSCHPIDELTM